MKNVIILTDYNTNFGGKYNAHPYNSGMNKELLSFYFSEYKIEVVFMLFAEVANYGVSYWKNKIVLYTSTEDSGYYYKSFIEDVVCYLELIGAKVVPSYKYLRAINNKVFMEFLRNTFNNNQLQSVSSKVFGCFEEMKDSLPSISFPVVYKQAAGAMSKGVGIANNQKELIQRIKKISRTKYFLGELWERARMLKYTGYTKQSKYRKKFIIQKFISGLSGDYKVLVFGDKYFVLKRDTRKGDFRASGSGIRSYVKDLPQGLLEYANLCKKTLNVPNASLDIACNGENFFLFEFQCLAFGSYTLTYSDFYWYKINDGSFVFKEDKSVLEQEYARSIAEFCFNE